MARRGETAQISRRIAIALIVSGATLMSATFGGAFLLHRGNEYTMYWFGLGGLLTVVGAAAIQRR